MDIVLISRTMIEGVANIRWALEDKETRVKNWFDYSAVYNHALLVEKNNNGSFVSDEDRESVVDEYNNKGKSFLTKGGKSHHSNFRCGTSILDILKFDANLQKIYSRFSDWVHWGSQSLRMVMNEESTPISYYETDHSYRIPALMNAFNCLHRVLSIVNEHFQLGFTEKLQAAQDNIIAFAKDSP